MAQLRSTLFIVLSPAGVDVSPFLALLGSHPDILAHGDMQGPLSEQGYAWLEGKTYTRSKASKSVAAFQRTFPEAFLYKYLFDSRGKRAVGFSVDYDTLLHPLNARLRNVLYHDTDVKTLHYVPRNSLRAYVDGLLREQGKKIKAVEVEAQKFVYYAKQLERLDSYVMRFFKEHDHLRLSEEAVSSARLQSTLKAVAEFLDVDTGAKAALADGDKPAPLIALVSNHAALKAALQDTPYISMLGA